jgi:hypothetical protein
MDPATLITIITLHDGTMRTTREPYRDAAICQQAAESLIKRGALSWCSRQWSTVIAR